MTKKIETQEIADLREKSAAAIAHHQKLDETLARVTGKVNKLESDMARFVFSVKDLEKEHRAAEKEFLRENITKQELDAIAKKQKDSVKAMHEAERALTVAKQVIDEVNGEIREAVNRANVARQKLANALRAELIAQLPDGLEDHLLKICGSYPDPYWQKMLFDTFPEPRIDEIKAAQAEFNAGLKS